MTKTKVLLYVAVGFGLLLAISFTSGQCRTWKTPKAPKEQAGFTDQGSAPPGPSTQAPTLTECLPVARPDLTRKELEAYAHRYGLGLTTLPQEAQRGKKVDQPTAPPAPQVEPPRYPILLTEESFSDFRSRAAVDVAAFLPSAGARVDLIANWKPWTPAPCPVCSSSKFFENRAKWRKEIFGGYVCSSKGCGLGGGAGLEFIGPKVGAVSLGAHVLGAYSPASRGVGFAGASVTW